ncbi:MAG: hypothetical protein PHY54_03245 [Methylococcales bacterium]|nr:hypothetical protein [Methylococcales bacterium]
MPFMRLSPIAPYELRLTGLLFGFNSFPSHIHLLDEDALVFGFISSPSKIQVFEDEAPDFGFNSLPSHTQLLGNSIMFAISISPLVVLKNATGMPISVKANVELRGAPKARPA